MLRVRMSSLQERGAALTTEDCQCIGLKIQDHWDGESVHTALKDIFALSGRPTAMMADQGSDLAKGIRLLAATAGKIPVINDIGQ